MGKLGTHGTTLKSLRWCSNYLQSKPLKTSVTFNHESEQFESQFQICIVLDQQALKVVFFTSTSRNGSAIKVTGIDRKNENFFKRVSDVEKLVLPMRTTACSPERINRGFRKEDEARR